MKIKLTIDSSNAAFDDDGNGGYSEAARILRWLAAQIVHDGPGEPRGYVLRDINGNRVGTASVETSED